MTHQPGTAAVSGDSLDSAPGALPLAGLRVLDFSVQLPGPLATLFLAEAGATVVKVERPGTGDIARLGAQAQGESVEFAFLNRGKRSIVLDLKSAEGLGAARRLAGQADVLVEQFRPGTMAKFALDYASLRESNRRLIYCSISGYGQTGALRLRAGHDLNYAARSGLLDISQGCDGTPSLPPTQVADIGGGSLPAVINILLALRRRDQSGTGCHLDVAMADNLFAWMRRPLAKVVAGEQCWPRGQHPSAGGLARYNIYKTADERYLAVAALEEVFWQRLCDLVGIPEEQRDDHADPVGVRSLLAAKLITGSAAHWMSVFGEEDVCVELVHSVAEAVVAARASGRMVFEEELVLRNGRRIPSLPIPIAGDFRRRGALAYPALGDTDPHSLVFK